MMQHFERSLLSHYFFGVKFKTAVNVMNWGTFVECAQNVIQTICLLPRFPLQILPQDERKSLECSTVIFSWCIAIDR